MELKDYTTEQLREELKRRAKEARAAAPRPPVSITAIAVVKSIRKSSYHKGICNWEYELELTPESMSEYEMPDDYRIIRSYLRSGVFRRNDAPKEGDVVTVRVRNSWDKFWRNVHLRDSSKIIAINK